MRASRKTRCSLLPSNGPKNTKTPSTVVKSLIWRTGRFPGSVLFDVTSCVKEPREAYRVILKKYPSRVAGKIHKEGSLTFIEVNFGENNHESIDTAYSKGFTLNGRTILAAPALQPDAKVVRVNLSNLPFLRPEKLEPGLRLSLACYGRILDVGICRDAELGAYMGDGYAVLDCHQPGGEQVYVPLQHHIPWQSSQDGFYAAWKNMPLHCMFCHQQGHNRNDCPQRPINKVVRYNCGEKGHIQSTCPRGLIRNKCPCGNELTTPTIRPSTQNNKKTNTQRTTTSEGEKPNETQEKTEQFQLIVYDPKDDLNGCRYFGGTLCGGTLSHSSGQSAGHASYLRF